MTSRFRFRGSAVVWLGTLIAAILMSLLVWLTADDGLATHLAEIVGATVGVHIALRIKS
jgi:hypothetical protein